jgi:hypothetical protein
MERIAAAAAAEKERKLHGAHNRAYRQQNSFNPDPETPEILILWQMRKVSPDTEGCDTS